MRRNFNYELILLLPSKAAVFIYYFLLFSDFCRPRSSSPVSRHRVHRQILKMDSESKFVRALVDNQDKKVTGLGLFFNQFCVLFTKCVGFKLNFGFLIQIIIPTIFVVCGGSLIQFIQQDRASKSMHEPSQPIQSSNVEIGDSHDHDQLPFQMLSSDVGEHLKNVSAGVSSYLYYSRESDDNTEVVQNFVSRLNIRFERCFPVFKYVLC